MILKGAALEFSTETIQATLASLAGVSTAAIPAGSRLAFYTSSGLSTRTYRITGATAAEVHFDGGVQEVTTTATYEHIKVEAGTPPGREITLSVDDGCTSANHNFVTT